MKHDDLIERLKGVFDDCITLAAKKNKDYAKVEDALENFRTFGVLGIVVRLGDKFYRLKNIIQKGNISVKGESINDTLRDMIVYSAIALILEADRQVPPEYICRACKYIPAPGDFMYMTDKDNQWICPQCHARNPVKGDV